MAKAQAVIDQTTQKNIDTWLKGDYDEASKNEIRRLQRENPEELLDAFYTHLNFGTGGLRGIMGVGTNRMNVYNVRAATQGLANYILKQTPKEGKHSAVISYDSRHHSREFAEETAKVLAANKIEVFLYKELRPVALASFGVLYKHCTVGIMITASHNAPKYNGYKVYWSHGGQVLPPHDKGIIDEVNRITKNTMVKTVENLSHPLIHEVDGEIDAAFLAKIHRLQMHPGDNKSKGKDLHIVYTSLHGAGITMVPRALKDWGFTHLTLVDEQVIPDGNFPTLKNPNPEEPEAMRLGIKKLEEVNADLLIATDPDTDRLGVVVMHANEPFFFNGNEVACMLAEHLCRSLEETHSMPPKPMFIKTIVTTELLRKIVEHHGATCLDVLTGFKYIGEKISQWEEDTAVNEVIGHHFIFGGEESYGYLLGTQTRDKDAIVSAACLCEAALQLKLQKKTLVDFLYEIYQKFGIYREKLISLTFEGKEGVDKMRSMMHTLRESPPTEIGSLKVVTVEDYLSRTILHTATGHKEPLTLPHSDVLRFWLEDDTKIVVRPSGTEPKIKLYGGIRDKHHHPASEKALVQAIQSCDRRLDEILFAMKKMLVK